MRQDTADSLLRGDGPGDSNINQLYGSAKLLSVVDLSPSQGNVFNNPFASRGELFVVQLWSGIRNQHLIGDCIGIGHRLESASSFSSPL